MTHSSNAPSRFWRIIQAANSLIFFSFGLLALLVLGFAAYKIVQDTFYRERSAASVVNTEAPVAAETEFNLNPFMPLAGTSYLMASYQASQTYQQSYYSKSTSSARNYLFFNTDTASTHWLVPKNEWLFLRSEQINNYQAATKSEKVVGLWYEVVKTDTNNDRRLTEFDRKVLALSDASGENYKELLPNVDQVIGSHKQGANTLFWFYKASGKTFVAKVDLPTRTLVLNQPLLKNDR
jgi:hypothetical protein